MGDAINYGAHDAIDYGSHAPASESKLVSQWEKFKSSFTDEMEHGPTRFLDAVSGSHPLDVLKNLPGGIRDTLIGLSEGDPETAGRTLAQLPLLFLNEGAAGRLGQASDAVRASAPGTAVTGAVKGAAKAAIDTTDLTRFGIKMQIPTVAANAGAGAAVARAVGLPHELGAAVGAGIPIVKGGITGAREALAARSAARAIPEPPLAAGPLPVSRQLPASNVIQMPAAADTSGPIPTNPQTGYPLRAGETPPEPAPVPSAPPPLDPKLLDDLARGLGGKSFEKLGPAGQETVRMLAAKMKAQPAAASPATPQPVAADNASIPQSNAVPPQDTPPAVPSIDVGSPSPAENHGTLQPQITTIPFSKESPPPEVFKAAARADRGPKVELIARHMADTGIDPEMVDKIQPGQWRDISDALKIDLPKSLDATIRDVKARLADLKAAKSTTFQPSPEMMEQLKKPGAMEAARKLAEAMQN